MFDCGGFTDECQITCRFQLLLSINEIIIKSIPVILNGPTQYHYNNTLIQIFYSLNDFFYQNLLLLLRRKSYFVYVLIILTGLFYYCINHNLKEYRKLFITLLASTMSSPNLVDKYLDKLLLPFKQYRWTHFQLVCILYTNTSQTSAYMR